MVKISGAGQDPCHLDQGDGRDCGASDGGDDANPGVGHLGRQRFSMGKNRYFSQEHWRGVLLHAIL